MNEDERFVREHWDSARFESVLKASKKWPESLRVHLPDDRGRVLCSRSGGGEWILSGNANSPFELSKPLPDAAAWSAARRFTEERLWQIRQVEEEIGYLSCRANFMVGEGWENHVAAIMTRVLAREQTALDSLRRGMKQPAAQTATE